MAESFLYTTQLQAGLGLINETKTLLDIWSPDMSAAMLYQVALESGRFPRVTARRLRNIVTECFAPRYLGPNGQPAAHLKRLAPALSTPDFAQLLLIFTCRANPILADFVREIYWGRYGGGHSQITNDDARAFIERAMDDGKTTKRWAESTVQRMSAYLTGCCADYGLLEAGTRSSRKVIPYRIAPPVSAYLAYSLHLAGFSNNAILANEDWGLFGLAPEDVLEEIKRLSLRGLAIVQAAADVVRISWKYRSMGELLDVLTQS
jgi:hypothetical protein